jgi:hypothetical protein
MSDHGDLLRTKSRQKMTERARRGGAGIWLDVDEDLRFLPARRCEPAFEMM